MSVLEKPHQIYTRNMAPTRTSLFCGCFKITWQFNSTARGVGATEIFGEHVSASRHNDTDALHQRIAMVLYKNLFLLYVWKMIVFDLARTPIFFGMLSPWPPRLLPQTSASVPSFSTSLGLAANSDSVAFTETHSRDRIGNHPHQGNQSPRPRPRLPRPLVRERLKQLQQRIKEHPFQCFRGFRQCIHPRLIDHQRWGAPRALILGVVALTRRPRRRPGPVRSVFTDTFPHAICRAEHVGAHGRETGAGHAEVAVVGHVDHLEIL
mmetsp:Transcript_12618/g.25259  ORF Transcript_12618/g.25259 Transcript_12618/m.25259 type:complete len:265 (-) Transcript_12618:2016-2810(-)